MTFRMLCGALALLLFVAPLGATVCGSCISGLCAPESDSAIAEAAPSGASAEPAAASPCHEAAATDAPSEPAVEPAAQEAPAPCHGAEPAAASLECCSASTAPTPERTATTTAPTSFDVAFVPAPRQELPAETLATARGPELAGPPPASPPLFTLHSAFLI